MGIERRLLIIGNAVLFSAFGCDDTPEDPPPGPDAQMRDAAIDGGAIDVGPEPDQRVADEGPLPDRDVDEGAPLDAAADVALPDAAADVAVADAASDLAFEPDLAVDMAPPEPDMAPPEPDMAPPEPDLGVVGCADLIGDRCEVDNEGCCVGGVPEAMCGRDATGALSWQPIPADWFCNCFPDDSGRDMVVCAVPGFVGVERAGRIHGAAPCLRTLARLLG
ncbi:MAG: hypothetical protein R3F65_19320 [bacterium]